MFRTLTILSVLFAVASAGASPPNFLVLLADDLRPDAIHALGNPHIQTPNLDKLVSRGASFSNAYIMGARNGAVCMPSRAMLMTGRDLFAFDESAGRIPEDYATFPELLRKAGYETFITGKWHQDAASLNRTFSTGDNIFMGGMHDPFNIPLHDHNPEGKYARDSAQVHKGAHATHLFADAAIGFLQGRDTEQPFLAYVSFTAPHDPRSAPAEYHDRYDASILPVPGNFLPEHPFDNGELRIRDEMLAGFPRTREEVQKHLADYYAMVTQLDEEVGRILAALKATGVGDNTVIVFASDHGLAVGSHGLMGKQNLYEHSIKLPLIIAGPGIPEGKTTGALVYLMDLGATLMDLAGLDASPLTDARSFAPVLKDPATPHRRFLTMFYREYQSGVRMDAWKYLAYSVNGAEREQLFNLDDDPLELKNLADDPAQVAIRDTLRSQLLITRDAMTAPK